MNKISILLPDLRGGGVERIRIVLAREFIKAGYEVEFVLMQARGELLGEAKSNFPIVDLGVTRFRNLPFKLYRYLRENNPDCLLVAMWPLTGIAAFTSQFLNYRICLVGSEHVDFRSTPSHKKYENLVLKYFGYYLYGRFKKVIAVSNGVAESLERVANIPSENIAVVHNPVRELPIGEMSHHDRQLLSGWLNSKVRIIAIGSLKKQKGFDLLLHVLRELRRKLDAKLLILGEGQLRNNLESLADKLGVSDHLFLPGFRPNLGAYLNHSHIFVLSSRWEGFGNVVIEALASGTPVVSTDCPSGPREILEDGKYGRLVSVNDIPAMVGAIIDTLNNIPDPSKLKERAAYFSPVKQATRYLKIINGEED